MTKGQAANGAGGILNYGSLSLENVQVSSNTSDSVAGGIYNAGTLRLNSGTAIIGNQAKSTGGGICNDANGVLFILAKGVKINSNNAEYGGGIYNATMGNINLDGTEFNGNTAKNDGGAIYNDGTANVANTVFVINGAGLGDGGAILNFDNGNLVITDSTFTGNTAAGKGGALRSSGNGRGTGLTVNGNQVKGGPLPGAFGFSPGEGGGIYIDPGSTFSLSNTVVAQNFGGSFPDVDGVFDDQGNNFIGDGTGGNFVDGNDGDQVGTAAVPLDPELGPLQDNGGDTLTELPLTGSPLIDAGDNTFAPATDRTASTVL